MAPKREKKCKQCRELFKPFRTTDKYCSPVCARAGGLFAGSVRRRLATIPDKEERKTVRKSLRAKNVEGKRIKAKASARARDNSMCRLRFTVRHEKHSWRIQVHHIFYLSEGGVDEIWNLITLCEECHHNIVHKNKKWQGKLLEILHGDSCFGELLITFAMPDNLKQKLRYFSEAYDDAVIKI